MTDHDTEKCAAIGETLKIVKISLKHANVISVDPAVCLGFYLSLLLYVYLYLSSLHISSFTQLQLVIRSHFYVHFIGSTESTGSFGGGGKAATRRARAFSASSAACLFNKISTQVTNKQSMLAAIMTLTSPKTEQNND